MATSITLPFWPSSLDCISWSQDNIIAVVGGEKIAILTPRLQDSGRKGKHWDTTIIQVNTFSAAELPLRNLLSNRAFSVGEELAVRQAVSAKWSWPGLARHRGCALAVLTADHTLSIWTLEGNRTNRGNWKRCIIVNKSIHEYYADRTDHGHASNHHLKEERAQVQQRIISFAWSQPVRKRDVNDCFRRGEQFLAVAVEEGDILIVRVDSPYGGISAKSKQWSGCVTGSWNVSITTPTLIRENRDSFPTDSSKNHFATDLDWGAWNEDEDHGRSANLAYIANGKLFTVLVQVTRSSNPIKVDAVRQLSGSWRWHLQAQSDLCGPLRFVNEVKCPEALVAFAPNTVFYIPVECNTTSEHSVESHHLDDRWDDVSGVAFTYTGSPNIRLHLASELSSTSAATATLALPFTCSDNARGLGSSWRYAINASSAVYSTSLDLAGKVIARTCGIASSPFGDYIATCTFFQPSDSIAYVIEADRACVLSISQEHETSDSSIFPRLDTCPAGSSVESLLFSTQRYLERQEPVDTLGGKDSKRALAQTLEKEVSLMFQTPADDRICVLESESDLDFDDIQGLIQHTQLLLYSSSKTTAARASRLVEVAMGHGRSPPIHHEIVQRLVEVILKVPFERLVMDEYSLQLQRIFQTICLKLSPQQEVGRSNVSADGPSEVCDMCQEDIPFESLRWAKCLRGHQYSRCALSFLAIQKPRITKRCGICKLHFLDETVLAGNTILDDEIEMVDVPDLEGNTSASATNTWVAVSHSTTARVTLVQVLFTACEVCVYCGGKYVDEN